ncbi:metaxin-2 isoform X2 [Aricia agestis]|uniref:metaxin-2 isoform X2 n=1 Tax=Aricia agestis TaxID=91739 RepID=UPI001C203A5C|nr:metaxin-2 isoform X2 [Aricia agestis]
MLKEYANKILDFLINVICAATRKCMKLMVNYNCHPLIPHQRRYTQEPWPDNVKLFQPYEVEQILLPDNASCLAVQAFLKMCNLPFEVEMRWNAEFMSPSGRVPFIKCGAFVVPELESIAQFAANKGVTLTSKLSSEERAEMRAYMSLITNVLVNAELYISWLDQETFNAVTKVRNSSVYPWPLGWIQTRSKRAAVVKRLKALHWHDKTLDQVLADVEQCCNSLSQRLGDKEFFFGTPTELDALVFGHVFTIITTRLPCRRLADTVSKCTSLVSLAKRIDERYFKRP